jgi:hypothetical protein
VWAAHAAAILQMAWGSLLMMAKAASIYDMTAVTFWVLVLDQLSILAYVYLLMPTKL